MQASLARTCHTFYEPALDVLWRTQYNLDALVECMPSVSWEQVDGELVGTSVLNELLCPLNLERHTQYFARPIGLSDCILFAFHARRIRSLFVEDFGSAEQVASILRQLPSLPSRCPFLKDISFDFYSPQDAHEMSRHLFSWVALDGVCVQMLDCRALVHLGSMPDLRILRFSLVPACEAGQTSLLNTFSSLQSLEFITNNRRHCCSFTKSVGTFHLSLELLNEYDNNPLHDDTTWVEFFWAVSAHCAQHWLGNACSRSGFRFQLSVSPSFAVPLRILYSAKHPRFRSGFR